jgi:hypothetical protein
LTGSVTRSETLEELSDESAAYKDRRDQSKYVELTVFHSVPPPSPPDLGLIRSWCSKYWPEKGQQYLNLAKAKVAEDKKHYVGERRTPAKVDCAKRLDVKSG